MDHHYHYARERQHKIFAMQFLKKTIKKKTNIFKMFTQMYLMVVFLGYLCQFISLFRKARLFAAAPPGVCLTLEPDEFKSFWLNSFSAFF